MKVERSMGEPSDQFPVGMRVLAVDDDRTCLKLLERMLGRCQYNVTTTNQAVKALEMLRENKNKFDLVISDVHMPDMDGFKLLELVGLEMDLPVIMLSANDDTKIVMKGITHGACDYLLKPIRLKELQNIWQHVVRRKKLDQKDINNAGSLDKPQINGEAAGMANIDQNRKLNKKRKDHDEDEDEEHDDNEQENDDPSTQKKPRVVWSIEMHRKFVGAVNQLGIDRAVPKKILELMNVEKLTRENVASHLQKYRLYLKRISYVTNQQASMAAALGSADSMHLRMESLNGFGNHTLVGSDQLHNTPFSSFHPSGVLGRLNTPAGLVMRGVPSPGMIQLGHAANSVNTSNNQSKMQSFLVPGNRNANILQGMPMSSEVDHLQSNKGVTHVGELPAADATAIFPVSANLIDARSTGYSNNPLLGGTSNSLLLEGSSQQAFLYPSNLRDCVSTMGFQNGNTLSDFTSTDSIPNQFQDSKRYSQYQATPTGCNAGQVISTPQEWNANRKDAPHHSNIMRCLVNPSTTVNGAMVPLGQCLDQKKPIFQRHLDLDSISSSNFVDPLSFNHNVVESSAMEPQEEYVLVQSRQHGSLEDLANSMIKQEHDKGKPADGYSLRRCI